MQIAPIDAIVYSHGNLKLAAERANVTEAELLSSLTRDLTAFQVQMRAAILMQIFNTWHLVQEAFIASLEDLEPKDLARAYTNMSASLASLSEPAAQASQMPLMDQIMSMLPEEQREAFKALVAKPA